LRSRKAASSRFTSGCAIGHCLDIDQAVSVATIVADDAVLGVNSDAVAIAIRLGEGMIGCSGGFSRRPTRRRICSTWRCLIAS
jgi:hypothetical protein